MINPQYTALTSQLQDLLRKRRPDGIGYDATGLEGLLRAVAMISGGNIPIGSLTGAGVGFGGGTGGGAGGSSGGGSGGLFESPIGSQGGAGVGGQ